MGRSLQVSLQGGRSCAAVGTWLQQQVLGVVHSGLFLLEQLGVLRQPLALG